MNNDKQDKFDGSDTKTKNINNTTDSNQQTYTISQKPGAARFIFFATLKTDLKTVASKLVTVPSAIVKLAENKVFLLNVVSRGINKKPLVFSIIEFSTNEIAVSYTYTAGMSPKKRFFESLSFCLSILTILKEDYDVEIVQIYQLISKILDEMKEFISLKYEALYSMYDNLNNEFIKLQKDIKNLKEANEQLVIENYVQKTKNTELQNKLNQYMNLSDDIIKTKIQEWIIAHNGEIDIVEFANVYNVHEGRVEQLLNKLLQEGFIDVK